MLPTGCSAAGRPMRWLCCGQFTASWLCWVKFNAHIMGMFCIVKWLINSYSVKKKSQKKRLLKKKKKKIKRQHKHTQRKGLLWGSQDFVVTCTVWQCLHVRTLQYQPMCMLASRLLPLPLVQCACVCRRQGGAAKQAKPQPTKGTHPAYVYVATFLRVWKTESAGAWGQKGLG